VKNEGEFNQDSFLEVATTRAKRRGMRDSCLRTKFLSHLRVLRDGAALRVEEREGLVHFFENGKRNAFLFERERERNGFSSLDETELWEEVESKFFLFIFAGRLLLSSFFFLLSSFFFLSSSSRAALPFASRKRKAQRPSPPNNGLRRRATRSAAAPGRAPGRVHAGVLLGKFFSSFDRPLSPCSQLSPRESTLSLFIFPLSLRVYGSSSIATFARIKGRKK